MADQRDNADDAKRGALSVDLRKATDELRQAIGYLKSKGIPVDPGIEQMINKGDGETNIEALQAVVNELAPIAQREAAKATQDQAVDLVDAMTGGLLSPFKNRSRDSDDTSRIV